MTSPDSPVGLDLDAIEARMNAMRDVFSTDPTAQVHADRRALVDEVRRLQASLRRVRSIGATSGTRLDAWNEAFDEIDRALGGVS